jgi:hypothetical protein
MHRAREAERNAGGAAIGMRRPERPGSRAALLMPTAIALLAFAVRLYGLGDKPFWLDEVASLHRATMSLPELTMSLLHADH